MNASEPTVLRRPLSGDPDSLPADLHPVLRRVYAARGLSDADELDRSLETLPPFAALSGIAAAVDLLQEALEQGRRILILADFDADGATSCAVAVRGLRRMGAADVRYLVPNRFEYGYGLTPEIVEVAARQQPDLIVTVDNGVSSHEGVATANAHGIRVLVTDHHLPGAELPAAAAMVNPNLRGDRFPSKNLAGVGVIFYVLLALRARLREQGWFAAHNIPEPNMAELLDLVALGTVADLVPLDRYNRALVSQGLRRIRAGRAATGILALLEIAGRNPAGIVAADLGFAVAPRLNAAGRLDDMSLGIECLLTDDPARARELASRLDEMNRQRREIEQGMQQQAVAALRSLELGKPDGLPAGLCLYRPDWHQGVIGILASRVKQQVHRPVIAFAPANGSELKGSGRSVSGLHLRDALEAVSTQHPGLLTRFGGHAMAAGLSLRKQDLDRFAAAFEAEVGRHLDAAALRGTLHSDGSLASAEFGLDLAELLREAGPWGQGFPEPLFDGDFELLDCRVVGERHLKMKVRCVGGDGLIDAIAFNLAEQKVFSGQTVGLVYRLDVNEYRGSRTAQLVVEHIRTSTPSR